MRGDKTGKREFTLAELMSGNIPRSGVPRWEYVKFDNGKSYPHRWVQDAMPLSMYAQRIEVESDDFDNESGHGN